MKTTHLVATLIAASLPLAAIVAEDSGKTETTNQKQAQNSGMTGMKEMMGMKDMMGKGQMMSNWKEQDAELDKLVTEMNNAAPEKKVDAVAAVVTKLVEQRKAMHERMQSLMSANEKEGMAMCRMMMGMNTPGESEHAHH